MNNQQQDKLKMYNSLIGICNQHLDILAAIPALLTAFDSFTDIVSSIRVAGQQKALDIKSVSLNKNQSRSVLTKKAAAIAAIVLAYARSTNNIELRGQVNYNHSDFLALRDEELLAVCQNIVNFVNASLAGLAPYNVTAATVAEFNTLIDQFRSALPRPRNAITQRSMYADTLKQLFANADDKLKNELDNIVLSLETTNPEFYNVYKSNRIIVDTSTTSSQIKGIITSKENNAPIKGVLITVLENGATAITNKKGAYALKRLPPGTYSIKITKEGYAPIIITGIDVNLGQITRIEAALINEIKK